MYVCVKYICVIFFEYRQKNIGTSRNIPQADSFLAWLAIVGYDFEVLCSVGLDGSRVFVRTG
jgi:hypothetical protein